MSTLEAYVALILKEEKEKTVQTVITQLRPQLEKMSKSEIELLQLRIDQLVKELG